MPTADRVVEPRGAGEVLLELLGEVPDRERGVSAEPLDRAFDTGARPVPCLAFRVALAHEEDRAVFVVGSREDQHRVGLLEAGEIPEVRVLTVGVLDVVVADVDGTRGEHGDGARAHAPSICGAG